MLRGPGRMVAGLAIAGLGALPLIASGGAGATGAGGAGALAAACVLALALVAGALPHRLPRGGPALLATGALAGLALLHALSLWWTPMVQLGWIASTVALAYVAVFVLAATLVRTAAAAVLLTRCLAAGAALLAAATIGDVVASSDPRDAFSGDRLAGAVGYQNGLATILLAGCLAVLPAAVAPTATGPAALGRAAAYGGLGLLSATAVACQSRGAMAGAAAGVALLVALHPGRARLVAPLAGVALVVAASLPGAIDLQDAVAAGAGPADDAAERWALGVAVAAVAMAAAGLAAGLLERRIGADPRARRAGRAVALAVVAAVVAAVAVAGVVRGGDVADRLREPLRTRDGPETRAGSRLASISSNGRRDLWGAAVDALRDAPLAGQGSGGYALWWNTTRDDDGVEAVHAHSLVLGTGAELGAAGVALLTAWLAGVGWSLARVVRRHAVPRAPVAALAAVTAAWVVTSSADWLWHLPAATLPAMACAGAIAGLAGAGSPAPARPPGRTGRVAAGVAAAALAAVALAFAGRPALADRALDDAAGRALTDPAGARDAIDRAASLDRFDPRIDALRAQVSLGEGDLARARRELVDGTRRLPDDYGTWERLGDFDRDVLGSPRSAVAAWRRALAVHRSDYRLREKIRIATAEITARGGG